MSSTNSRSPGVRSARRKGHGEDRRVRLCVHLRAGHHDVAQPAQGGMHGQHRRCGHGRRVGMAGPSAGPARPVARSPRWSRRWPLRTSRRSGPSSRRSPRRSGNSARSALRRPRPSAGPGRAGDARPACKPRPGSGHARPGREKSWDRVRADPSARSNCRCLTAPRWGGGPSARTSALAGLIARVGFVDDVDPSLAAHHLAVPVTGLQRLQ
jgi:hypothetical protein